MIGVVATMKIKPETTEAFEAAMLKLVADTRANEPGVKHYQLCKSATDPTTYVVMELYQDQAALDGHMKSDHFRGAGPALGACLAGRPTLDRYETLDP